MKTSGANTEIYCEPIASREIVIRGGTEKHAWKANCEQWVCNAGLLANRASSKSTKGS